MRRSIVRTALIACVAINALSLPVRAEPAGRITGVGGVFVTSSNPKALAEWYRDVLGIALEPWGGASLRYDTPGHPPAVVWNVLHTGSDYLAPSKREFMLDFAVDDLDAFVARLKAKGVVILKQDDSDPSGNFAWILDSGRHKDRALAAETALNRIQLWITRKA